MRYKTLSDLKQAIDRGEVNSDCSITLDNDSTTMYEMFEEIDSDGEVTLESGEVLFDGGMPGDLLAQALDLLGIPNEPA